MKALVLIMHIAMLAAAVPLCAQSVYDSDEFRDRYGARVLAPPFDFTQDLSSKSLQDLRCLRNELFARKGYLFKDAALRAHFQRFEWYQPVWWVKGFAATLDPVEEAFVAKVQEREKLLLGGNFSGVGDARRANVGNLVNTMQFERISDTLREKLAEHGFAIVPERQQQLFDIYEENDYSLTPSFITTDLYLQLMHMYFDFTLRTLEEKALFSVLSRVLGAVHAEATALAKGAAGPDVKRAAEFVAAYTAVPLALIAGKKAPPPPASYAVAVRDETTRITAASGRGSRMLGAPLFDYSQFRPRGHYTRTKALGRYFQAMMWLQTAPILLDGAEGLGHAAVLSWIAAQGKAKDGATIASLCQALADPLRFLVGEPDNLSVMDGIAAWRERMKDAPLASVVQRGAAADFREVLLARNPERIVARGGSDDAQSQLAAPRMFFIAQRYTPDAEILQRLVHVRRDPVPMRPIPKGLDVFAAFGNKTATSILLSEYRETDSWPAYGDSLHAVHRRFADPIDASTVYGAWLSTLRTLERIPASAQPFMHSDAWQRKCLNSSLASWTELKHDAVLYAKQPNAAECGGDEPPPPPVTCGYVEPAVDFWVEAVGMVQATKRFLDEKGLMTPEIKAKSNSLLEMGDFLLRTSRKELAGEHLSEKEFETIRLLGASAANITLSIIDAPDWYSVTGPDRSIAVATDVYTYNTQCLQEAVGNANSIYVVVEIDGLLYLTRGAVFSYHEFTRPSSDRLTDEAWQQLLQDGAAPGLPLWMKPLLAPIVPLEMAPGSSYSSGC